MPESGAGTGVTLPQPCDCTVFMSFRRSAGSFSFNFGRPLELASCQPTAATVLEICCISA